MCHTNGTRAPSCRHQAAQDGGWWEAHTPSSVSQTHLEAPLRPRCHASHQGEAYDTHLLVTQYPIRHKTHWLACRASLNTGLKRPLRVASILISSAQDLAGTWHFPPHPLAQALLCACDSARTNPARVGKTDADSLLSSPHSAQARTRVANIGVGRNTPPSAPRMPSSTILAIRGPVSVIVTQVRWSKLPSSLVDTHAPPVGPRRMCSRP